MTGHPLTDRLREEIRTDLFAEASLGNFSRETQRLAKAALEPFEKGEYTPAIKYFEKLLAMLTEGGFGSHDIDIFRIKMSINELKAAQQSTA